MLTGLHFLLSYMCNLECDHCFVYGSPRAEGTFTLRQVRKVLDEAVKIGSVECVYFEGGEPFLFYPLMVEGIKLARERGFKVGVVTNAYFATTREDAELWLGRLRELGVSDLSVSDDSFHTGEKKDRHASYAQAAAKRLGLSVNTICVKQPSRKMRKSKRHGRTTAATAGAVMLRGRAVEKLAAGLPRRPWKEFAECPYEDLKDPKRVHLDAFGNVHLCQGLSMGNMWRKPLAALVKDYRWDRHPICGALVRGGPALLAREQGVLTSGKYVDACHFCFVLRKTLIRKFPQFLAPGNVLGIPAGRGSGRNALPK